MAKLRYVGITVAIVVCVAVVLIGAVVIRVAVPYVADLCCRAGFSLGAGY